MTVDRIPITSRDQWLALRKQDVTASVAGALLGVHDFTTPYGLWALKSGAITEDPEETAAMKRGRLLEPVAAALLAEQQPNWEITRGDGYLRDAAARLGATPDVFAHDPERGPGVVQIKSVEAGIFRKKWKNEDGEITPPLWIVVQGIVEAHLAGAKWAAVAPLVIGFGVDLHVIDIPIHAGVIDRLKNEITAFWQRVEDGRPPDADYARDGAVIAQLYARDDGTSIDLSTDNHVPVLLEEDDRLSDEESACKARRKEIKNELLAKIGVASSATCQGWAISAKTINRKAYSVAPSSYRQVRATRINAQERAS